MFYTIFLNAILVLVAIIGTTLANGSCAALYCVCAYQTRAPFLKLPPQTFKLPPPEILTLI